MVSAGDGSVLKKNSIVKLAKDKNATPPQVAIAWLLARSPMMLPIPGTSSITHLEENMGAVKVSLTAEDMKRLGCQLSSR